MQWHMHMYAQWMYGWLSTELTHVFKVLCDFKHISCIPHMEPNGVTDKNVPLHYSHSLYLFFSDGIIKLKGTFSDIFHKKSHLKENDLQAVFLVSIPRSSRLGQFVYFIYFHFTGILQLLVLALKTCNFKLNVFYCVLSPVW